jgi:hypothetical protein
VEVEFAVAPKLVVGVKGVLAEKVTAPVAPDTVIPDPATAEVTPALVMVSAPLLKEAVIPVPPVKVVVATPLHTPLLKVSTCPGVAENSEVVEMAVGAADPAVRLASTVLAPWVASWVRARVPEMVERLEVAPL